MANLPENNAILAVLESIFKAPNLSQKYSFKGGNALKLAYESPRASVDIDLSSVRAYPNLSNSDAEVIITEFCESLDKELAQVHSRYGFTDMRVQKRRIIPPNKDPREFPAFQITVGYTKTSARRAPYPEVVKMDVTLNEVVCETEMVEIEKFNVRVSSLEDILAEKLRALLQQPIRNRFRPNDVFDIWYYVSVFRKQLDKDRISRFLIDKKDTVDGLDIVTKKMFYAPEVRRRAEVGYAEIEQRVPDILPKGLSFPAFESAFSLVLEFVYELDIPMG